MPKVLTFGLDDGSYLAWNRAIQFNWEELYTKAGVRYVIWKGDQEWLSDTGNISTTINLEASRRVLPVNACYYWHYPDVGVQYYVDRYSRAIDRENPDFIGVDIEQKFIVKNGVSVLADPNLFSDTAQGLCEGLAGRYPEKRLVPYTGYDILSTFPKLKTWLPKFKNLWLAAWPDYGLPSYVLTWEQLAAGMVKSYPSGNLIDIHNVNVDLSALDLELIFHQFSSRRRPPYVSGQYFYHQYDWNAFPGTEAELIAWVNKQDVVVPDPIPDPIEVKMTEIFDKNTPQGERANIVTLWNKQAHANIKTLSDGGTDAFILAMGGMDGDDAHKLYDDSAWRIRVAQVAAEKKPVIGMYTVAGDYYQRIQTSGEDVDNMARESNPVLKKIINSLRVDANWTLDTISANDGKWLPVNGLLFALYKTTYASGQQIGHDWQRRTLESILKPILFLQEVGKMPKLPIIVSGEPDFFKLYDFEGSEFGRYMLDMHHQISLGLVQHYFVEVPTATTLTATECWSYRVPDAFKFTSIPYGYGSDMTDPLGDGHTVYHEASYNRFLFEGVTDSFLKPTAPNTGFFCKNKLELYKFLGFTAPVEPPPPDEPPDEPPDDGDLPIPEDVETRLTKLEAFVAAIKALFAALARLFAGLS